LRKRKGFFFFILSCAYPYISARSHTLQHLISSLVLATPAHFTFQRKEETRLRYISPSYFSRFLWKDSLHRYTLFRLRFVITRPRPFPQLCPYNVSSLSLSHSLLYILYIYIYNNPTNPAFLSFRPPLVFLFSLYFSFSLSLSFSFSQYNILGVPNKYPRYRPNRRCIPPNITMFNGSDKVYIYLSIKFLEECQ